MTQSAESIYRAAQTSSALLHLSGHSLTELSGPDCVRYLQGRITQNIKGLAAGQSARTLLLTPQGRVQGSAILLATGESFLCIADPDPQDTPPGSGSNFLRALLQFKVADQITAQPLFSSHDLYSLQGPAAQAALEGIGGSVRVVTSLRGGSAGFDLIIPKADTAKVLNALRGLGPDLAPAEGTEEVRQMLRIRAGIPEVGSELTEKTIATEVDVTGLVSFNKGCYAGQEVVEMSTARGRPNRKLRLFRAETAQAVAPGAALMLADQKPCGEITSSSYFPSEGTCYFLGFIRTSTPDDATVFSGEIACQPQPLP